MRDRSSFHKRSSEGTVTAAKLAAEMQAIARSAAEPPAVGDTIKAQMRRSWAALRNPPWWRVRAAWYGDAGCWSGRAIEDFRARHAARLAKEEAGRAKASAIASLLVSTANRLEAVDADFHGAEIDRLRRMAGRIGAQNSAVASRGRGR